ncbi:MAG: hypothetical protein AAF727_02640 [Pseudomonadota bacterium]
MPTFAASTVASLARATGISTANGAQDAFNLAFAGALDSTNRWKLLRGETQIAPVRITKIKNADVLGVRPARWP